MEFTVKNKSVEIKFDYRLMFAIDKKLATTNAQTGEKNNDGVANLFSKILNKDDQGIVDLIVLSTDKTSENEAITAIVTWLEDHGATDTDELFKGIQDEMVESGFFKGKILKYIANMEKALKYMKGQKDIDEVQVKAVEETIGEMKNAVS
ncbi:hypothetical protein ABID29_001831 [Streptococcus rupicaprae]|uniref:Phage protein n=1 Tax=Streptococcus rupicaprae TaxID=759619 RepID=A0ABV2FJG2_9STRE